VSAEIFTLSDYRIDDSADGEIDLATAVDVADRPPASGPFGMLV
jgi:hypothetical protein